MMKTFAQILNGRLHWIFEAEEKPEFAPEIRVVDVTGLDPTPNEGWLWDGVAFAPPPRPPLDDVKAHASERVDEEAESARTSFVTPGAYQSDEYHRAADEAQRYVDGAITDSAALQADVDAGTVDPRTGAAVTTQADAANLILYRKELWEAALDAIRAVRLKAKADIAAAPDASTVQVVLDGLTWPTPQATI